MPCSPSWITLRDAMRERLVYLRDSLSLMEVPAAVELLERHRMRLVKTVPRESRGNVVAIVAGLGRFESADARDFPGLRTVARFGAGYDNIDVKGLWDSRRVAVSYTPDISSGEVAELALAMMILTLRGVPRDVAGLSAEPSRWRAIGRGVSLSDATVGIVGCGRIGLAAARLVAPLASRVLLWNRSRRPVALEGVPGSRYEQVESLNELAVRSDVVSIHLALTLGSQGLVGSAFFEAVRAAGRSIALVNTARGNVVDEEALLEALEAGIVRAAAIDVWSLEGPLSTGAAEAVQAADRGQRSTVELVEGLRSAAASNSGAGADHARLRTVDALRHHPAVLPTSHIGAFTTGVLYRCAMQCAQNIIAVVEGEQGGSLGYVAIPES